MRPGDALGHSIGRRTVQHYLAVLKTLDWTKFRSKVEFLDSPGLFANGRLFTISGGGGTLYPPFKLGDVVVVEVTGADLGQLMERRVAHKVKNPYLYDKSDVIVTLSGYMDSGEPAGRKASTPPVEGEWLLVNAAGAEVRIPTVGDVVVKPAPGRKVYIGGTTNAKAVLVHGDSNAAGGVSSSQTKLYVGDP